MRRCYRPGSAEEHGCSLEEAAVDRLQIGHALLDRDAHDLGSAQRHHLAEVGVVRRVDGLDAEPCGQDAIERVGLPPRCTWPSASCALRSRSAARSRRRGVDRSRPGAHDRSRRSRRSAPPSCLPSGGAFGGDDDGEVRALLVAMHEAVADLVDVERLFGNQDDVGAAGHARSTARSSPRADP